MNTSTKNKYGVVANYSNPANTTHYYGTESEIQEILKTHSKINHCRHSHTCNTLESAKDYADQITRKMNAKLPSSSAEVKPASEYQPVTFYAVVHINRKTRKEAPPRYDLAPMNHAAACNFIHACRNEHSDFRLVEWPADQSASKFPMFATGYRKNAIIHPTK